MGGEREVQVEKKKDIKLKSSDESIGNFRIHESNGEVHFHDDTNKFKAAIPVSAWWRVWEKLRNEPGSWSWIDPVNKTKLTVETAIDHDVFDVKISVCKAVVSSNYDKINTFTKRK